AEAEAAAGASRASAPGAKRRPGGDGSEVASRNSHGAFGAPRSPDALRAACRAAKAPHAVRGTREATRGLLERHAEARSGVGHSHSGGGELSGEWRRPG